MEHKLIYADNLTIGYHSRPAGRAVMSGLSFSLDGGQMACIVGANGIGKSTLLRTVIGAQPALQGSVRIRGVDVGRMHARSLSRLVRIALTDKTMTRGLTAAEVVALGRTPHTGFWGRLTSADRRIVERSMALAGIDRKAASPMAELSDGERQKVMIAKALAQECPVMILDEPTAFLDTAGRIETMQLLHRLTRTERKAIMLTTHDVGLATRLADRLWLMTPGGMTCGVPEDLIARGALDSLTAGTSIRFDAASGTFETTPDIGAGISLHCPDATLKRLIMTALSRNDIDRAGTDIRIEAQSATSISVLTDGQRHQCTSIGRMLDSLSAQAAADGEPEDF